MYIALNQTLVPNLKVWPDFAQLAAKTGFGGVDVMLGPAMQAGVGATIAMLKELKLQPSMINLPVDFRKDDATFQHDFARLPDAAAFAAAIGCPRVCTWILPSSDLPKAEQRKIYVDRLGACADVLRKNKVRFGLEYVSPVHIRKAKQYEFIYRMDEMLAMAKDCGSNCGLMLDSWHWHHADATVDDIIAAGKDRIVYVQVADAPKLPPDQIRDNERLMPGEGVIDFKAFFGALRKIGYDDGVSPEVFGRGLKEMDPAAGAALGLKSTQKAMATS